MITLCRNAICFSERQFLRFENVFYCNTPIDLTCMIARCYAEVVKPFCRNVTVSDHSGCEDDESENFGNLQKALEISVGNKTNLSHGRKEFISKVTVRVRPNAKSKSFNHVLNDGKRAVHSTRGAFPALAQDQDETDVFGRLSEGETDYKEFLSSEFLQEGKDDESTQVLVEGQKRKRIVDYGFDMRNLARSGKLKEALELLDWLNKRLRIQHESAYLFTLAIGFCGRAGYTEKAFRLFRQLKDRGLKVTPAVLTGLFNSCAECPFPDYGLERARYLYESILEKGWRTNEIVYHAAIKAFGRCGDMGKAFELVDEMVAKKHAVTAETFSFLLMACVSDADAGFSHAVSVVRKMLRTRIRPSTFVFDLLLRATRDCGLGPPELVAKLLLEWKPKQKNQQSEVQPFAGFLENKLKTDIEADALVCGDAVEAASLGVASPGALEIPHLSSVQADLLLPKPQGCEIVALRATRHPWDRLNLLGGLRGILSKLHAAKLCPSVKTFTILLGCIPPRREAESQLLLLMDEWRVPPDVDFFNVLIKRRGVRRDLAGARDVLDLVRQRRLQPDVATFGALAITCQTRSQSQSFLAELASCGVRPNVEMFGALMYGAKEKLDFGHLLFLLKAMREHGVCPDARMLQVLEGTRLSGRRVLLQMDQASSRAVCDCFQQDQFAKFSLYYSQWLKAVQVELPAHPWKQYGAQA